MSLRDKLLFDTTSLPTSSDVQFGTETFTIELLYRELTDNYYLNIYDSNGYPLIKGEKLVYGMHLWDINDERLPSTPLIVLDETGTENSVGLNNFQKSVFIYYDDLPDDILSQDDSYETDISDDLLDDDDDIEAVNDNDASYSPNPYALPNGGDTE